MRAISGNIDLMDLYLMLYDLRIDRNRRVCGGISQAAERFLSFG